MEDAIRTLALGGEVAATFREGRLVELPEADEMEMWAAGDVAVDSDDGDEDDAEIEEARDLLDRAELEAKRARELVEDLTQRVEDLEETLRRERADLEAAARQADDKTRSAEKAADRLKRLQA